MARECRSKFKGPFGLGRDTSGNLRDRSQTNWRNRPNSNSKFRVREITSGEVIEEDDSETAEASGYTANCISYTSSGKSSTTQTGLHNTRKLLAVPGIVNGQSFKGLLVDCGSPVTLIRADMWKQVKLLHDCLVQEEEQLQGVTNDGLKVLGLTYL
jgi:hypothetical protein